MSGHIPGADLVSIPPPLLLGHIQAALVSGEAAVGPVGEVEAEGATVLRVTWILDGDGAGHHGDHTAAACIPLPLDGGVKNDFSPPPFKKVSPCI